MSYKRFYFINRKETLLMVIRPGNGRFICSVKDSSGNLSNGIIVSNIASILPLSTPVVHVERSSLKPSTGSIAIDNSTLKKGRNKTSTKGYHGNSTPINLSHRKNHTKAISEKCHVNRLPMLAPGCKSSTVKSSANKLSAINLCVSFVGTFSHLSDRKLVADCVNAQPHAYPISEQQHQAMAIARNSCPKQRLL